MKKKNGPRDARKFRSRAALCTGVDADPRRGGNRDRDRATESGEIRSSLSRKNEFPITYFVDVPGPTDPGMNRRN